MLSEEERRALLEIARRSLDNAMARRSGDVEPVVDLPGPMQGNLGAPGGVFVTLRVGGELRGCIGYLESPYPLARVVGEVVEKAAFEDPRFTPLTSEEIDRVSLEISVLGPFRKVSDIAEIQVGEHGLLIECGSSRGVLLPQVAVEYGWDRLAFLHHVALKAGLAGDAWKDPSATLYTFCAEIIKEGKDG